MPTYLLRPCVWASALLPSFPISFTHKTGAKNCYFHKHEGRNAKDVWVIMAMMCESFLCTCSWPRNRSENLLFIPKLLHSQICIVKSVPVIFVVDLFYYCGSIIDFLRNSYFILQIYHAKSFKMRYVKTLYLTFLLRNSQRPLNIFFHRFTS